MNLYQIERAALEALEGGSVNEETGEVEINLEALEALAIAKEEKVESICLYIKNLVADVAAFRAEEAILTARRKATEMKVERLKTYLSDSIGGQEFESSKYKLSWRKSVETKISDESKIPSEYLVTKTTTSADKTAIKKAIMSGKQIDGAEVIEKVNPQIK